jgi:PAS domain-containing protein
MASRRAARWRERMMLAGDVYRLLEGTADAAFVVTVEGEICFWNAAAERLFGYARADVLNRTCADVFKGKGALGTVVCTESAAYMVVPSTQNRSRRSISR